MEDNSTVDAIVSVIVLGAPLVLLAFLIVLLARSTKRRLPKSIVVEYLPPRHGTIIEHGLMLRADRRVLTAALIDLAVRGQVRVLSGPKDKPVAIEVVPGAMLTSEERLLLAAFLPEQMTFRQQDKYLAAINDLGVRAATLEEAPHIIFLRGSAAFKRNRRRELTKFFDKERERLTEDGFTRKSANSAHLVVLSLIFLAAALMGLVLMLGAIASGDWPAAPFVFLDVALLFWILTLAPPPLLRFTDQGNAARRYLSGLRDYMSLVERDRLQFLQSPEGALRTPAGALTPGGQALGLSPRPTAGDPVAQSALDRYVLTERLLPYAILFRQEKQWQAEFEHLGGPIDVSRNLGALQSTFNGVVTVLQVIAVILQVLRVIGAILALAGKR